MKKKKVDLNNKINITLYEENLNFSSYSTSIKSIALYFPDLNYNNKYLFNYKKNNEFISYSSIMKKIKKQIELAKSHGIYGFAIFYNFYNKLFNLILNFFLDNKEINFPFFLIWKNDYINILLNYSLKKAFFNKQRIIQIELEIFIQKINKYIKSQLYLKIKGKPIISISKPDIFPNIKKYIIFLRKKAKEKGIGELFILYLLTKINSQTKIFKSFDSIIDLQFNFNKETLNDYYSGAIYQNILLNKYNNNFTIYKSSRVNLIKNSKIINLKDYKREKFYIYNKNIIEWTKSNYDRTNGYFFINSWNNYDDGNYLEPDEIYGFSLINSFSKALFNLPLNDNKNNIFYLSNKSLIAIQVHLYYEDLLEEIINKTNNIPLKFDLFITMISSLEKIKLDQYLKTFSKANKYEIKTVENKGRDILPLIIQMKNKIKNYKYLCHLHTKKSKHKKNLGEQWRNYLYENLLGSKIIITEILSDFEHYEKLGFIFPEPYYEIIKNIFDFNNIEFGLHRKNKKYMNYVLNKIFPGYEIGNNLIFPLGNMFWAKVNSIHQIFKIRFLKKFPKELNQTDGTIMHAIERIWLYLVKLNGFYYKIIFKYYKPLDINSNNTSKTSKKEIIFKK